MNQQTSYPSESEFLDENLLQQTTSKMKRKVLEYGRLSQIVNPSLEEEHELDQILDDAINDSLLNFWIEHVDHVLAHHHNLLTEEARESYRNQGAMLRDIIDLKLCFPDTSSEESWTGESSADQETTKVGC